MSSWTINQLIDESFLRLAMVTRGNLSKYYPVDCHIYPENRDNVLSCAVHASGKFAFQTIGTYGWESVDGDTQMFTLYAVTPPPTQ
jgi:hypothetical protein